MLAFRKHPLLAGANKFMQAFNEAQQRKKLELEEAARQKVQHQATLALLKQKHEDRMEELQEEMEWKERMERIKSAGRGVGILRGAGQKGVMGKMGTEGKMMRGTGGALLPQGGQIPQSDVGQIRPLSPNVLYNKYATQKIVDQQETINKLQDEEKPKPTYTVQQWWTAFNKAREAKNPESILKPLYINMSTEVIDNIADMAIEAGQNSSYYVQQNFKYIDDNSIERIRKWTAAKIILTKNNYPATMENVEQFLKDNPDI